MDEPLNEYDGPNPLEQLAEKVRILVEKCELPIAIGILQRADAKDLVRYARTTERREPPNEKPSLANRIERAIMKNPKWSDQDIAKLLRVGKASVWRTRRDMKHGER